MERTNFIHKIPFINFYSGIFGDRYIDSCIERTSNLDQMQSKSTIDGLLGRSELP